MMFDPNEENKLEPMTKTANPLMLRSYLEDLYKKKNLGDDQRSKLESSIAESRPGAGLTFLASLGAGLAGQNQLQAVDALNQGVRDKQKELEDFDKKRSGVFDELKRDREINKFQVDQQDELESNDPNSEQSKLAQAIARRMFPKADQDFSKLSARALTNTMPAIRDVFTTEEKSEENRLNREAKADKDKADREAKAAIAEEKKAAAAEKAQIAKAPQSLAAGFGKRLEQAENDFARLEGQKYSRADAGSGFESILPNMFQSKETQQQNQAERNFLTALLRRESGAVISDDEFASGSTQYFPRVGDSPEVLAQKKRNRDQVRASLKAEAGPAWDQVALVSKEESKGPLMSKQNPASKAPDGMVKVINPQTNKPVFIKKEKLDAALKSGATLAE